MYDIVIVGCGLAGMVNALLLVKDSDLRIAILDSKVPQTTWSSIHYDPRVYAITPASQKILESIGAWPLIQAKRLSPYTRMQVWDGRDGAELAFDHASLNVPVLGHILEESLVREALLEKIKSYPQLDLLFPVNLSGMQEHPDHIELQLLDNDPAILTRLLIGADGAQSWVRAKAGIPLHVQSYEHSALIAQVQTEQVHQQTARQVFLCGDECPPGPLAFLPLQDPHQCSIVWSTLPTEADRLLQLDENEFQDVLGKAFSFRLGKIQAVSKRRVFPLYERHVEHYVKNRLALIGDAAHTLHPLAGQGINLGITDAACLSEVILSAVKRNRDFASLPSLRPYERTRKGENFIMLNTVKLLKNLFASDNKSVQALRSQGLKAVNQFTLLKNFFASYAMGQT